VSGEADRLDALVGIALRLAGSAPTGRIALAQLARSVHPSWIPLPWGETILAELQSARAATREPIPAPDVERVLREAWGAKPTDELDELDPEPVAITPAAQVHRAVYEGDPVAVKVLRPGLSGLVRQDLTLLESLASPLAAAFPALDPRALLAEVRERVLDELDLEHEAGVMRRVHRALRGHPLFTVPAPVTALSHENVLVSQWLDGVPLREVDDRDDAAGRLVLFVLGGLRAGIVHADPDPDDVLVLGDGRLAVLDFGATRVVERERGQLTAAAFDAFAREDVDALGRALNDLGWLDPEHAQTAFEFTRHALGDLAGPEPARLDHEAVVAARDRALSRPRDLLRLLTRGSLEPEDLWPSRGVAQAFGAIAQVGATGPWRELASTALRDGWDARLPA
jgi:predicted unusual protein kinase regulating ubiquinone biosynthesis (AarF/ABC1/UbiB family)